jgi:N-acetylmuramoyl-L-alanine amidase
MKPGTLLPLVLLSALLFVRCGTNGASPDHPDESDGVSVLVDVGHGGYDRGGASATTGMTEADLTVALGGALARKLSEGGIAAMSDREANQFVSLDTRIALARQLKPGLVVSLHLNMSHDVTKRGFAVWYQKGREDSRRLARYIQKELTLISFMKDNGIQEGSFRILRQIDAPSVYVSLAHLSNEDDATALTESAKQSEIVAALTRAVAAYRGS